jgi:hypothetical protein
MINLKKETLDILNAHGKTVDDVVWCGTQDGWFDINMFLELADFNYDNGYGSVYIPMDLVVVGQDFWLERGEYDGAEGWNFKTHPVRPENFENFPKLK